MKVESVAIDTLTLDPANARKHDEKNLSAIKGSLARFGQQKPIVVDNNSVVIAGNGTLEAAKSLGWTRIDIVRTDLTGSDRTAFALADNRTNELSTWDDEALGKLLQSLHEEDYPIAEIGFDPGEFDWGAGDPTGEGSGGPEYTKKIEAPIYEPKGEEPALIELVDISKASELKKEIHNADIPADVKLFLSDAADRHKVFNYEKIAEYYAHAPAEIQTLMEKSALVIIDFDKAIENGFVRMSEELAAGYKENIASDFWK